MQVQLTLLSRAYCHLCDEMETALRPLLGSTPLQIIDIDEPGHAGLEAQYGDAVPVLFEGEPATGRELCRHRLDPETVRAVLSVGMGIR